MKAKQINGSIVQYKTLPNTYTKNDGSVILNFKKADTATLEAEGFFDVVKPDFNSLTQTKGGMYFDSENNIFTYDVTDIDFDQNIDIIGEDGEPTGETEKKYKLADIKASKIGGINDQAGKLLQPTDWQVIRKSERNIDIDTEVVTERADILTEADRLKAEVNALESYAEVLQYNIQFFPSDEEIV
jgi:hypothetical protein